MKSKAGFFLLAALVYGADQLSKYLVVDKMSLGETLPVIADFFHLTYILNEGASFGLLRNFTWFFIVLTVLVVLFIVWLVFRTEGLPFAMHIVLGAISGGALGNLTDRLRFGAVVDFLDFRGIWQYIFNVADMAVVCGGFLLVIMYIYYERKGPAANV